MSLDKRHSQNHPKEMLRQAVVGLWRLVARFVQVVEHGVEVLAKGALEVGVLFTLPVSLPAIAFLYGIYQCLPPLPDEEGCIWKKALKGFKKMEKKECMEELTSCMGLEATQEPRQEWQDPERFHQMVMQQVRRQWAAHLETTKMNAKEQVEDALILSRILVEEEDVRQVLTAISDRMLQSESCVHLTEITVSLSEIVVKALATVFLLHKIESFAYGRGSPVSQHNQRIRQGNVAEVPERHPRGHSHFGKVLSLSDIFMEWCSSF